MEGYDRGDVTWFCPLVTVGGFDAVLQFTASKPEFCCSRQPVAEDQEGQDTTAFVADSAILSGGDARHV
jgi:hypothetical protein